MALYCPITGVKVRTDPKWINQKVSTNFIANFWIIGSSIIYSLPKGHADLNGVQKSLSLNDKVKKFVSAGESPYIQIEDFNLLTSSSLPARKYFIDKMNNDKRIAALIFCNLSLPFSIAVNIGQRFNTTGKDVHVVSQYRDAVKLALTLSPPEDPEPNNAPIELSHIADNTYRCLSPVELLTDDAWNIDTPNYSNRVVLIDRCIMHSTSKGYLESKHMNLIDSTRSLCRQAISEDSSIDYIIVDATRFKGGSRITRAKYMQSLKSWHQRYPLKMYVMYGTNTFMKTALHLAKPLMPFKVKIAKDINHAFDLTRKDRAGKCQKHLSLRELEKPTGINHKDIERVMAFVGSINWEQKGIDSRFDMDESHPFFFLYQSIKLIKEELDSLFAEREKAESQIAASLKEKEVLLREIHHRVKNNMQSIISLLRIHSRRTQDTRLKQIFSECQDRINAMSLIHETLYQSEDLARIDFENYLKKLCRSLSQAHGAAGKGIDLVVERCDVVPSMDQGIAVGMVVCELVANAFQHAFPAGQKGKVSVSLSGLGEKQVELIVSDNGKGLPVEIEIENSPSLGLQLTVATVTRELNGSIKVERDKGTRFIIRFKCQS